MTLFDRTCQTCGSAFQTRYADARFCQKSCIRHRSLEERFWAKVDKNGPVPASRPDLGRCWLWTGATAGEGYGRIRTRARYSAPAHRLAYEWLVGPIGPGLEPDHLCRVVRCVNPAHIELVTPSENVRRGTSPAADRARRTHCPQGHEYTPANTYRNPTKPKQRACLACMRIRNRGGSAARGHISFGAAT